jgi:hypothetical protein
LFSTGGLLYCEPCADPRPLSLVCIKTLAHARAFYTDAAQRCSPLFGQGAMHALTEFLVCAVGTTYCFTVVGPVCNDDQGTLNRCLPSASPQQQAAARVLQLQLAPARQVRPHDSTQPLSNPPQYRQPPVHNTLLPRPHGAFATPLTPPHASAAAYITWPASWPKRSCCVLLLPTPSISRSCLLPYSPMAFNRASAAARIFARMSSALSGAAAASVLLLPPPSFCPAPAPPFDAFSAKLQAAQHSVAQHTVPVRPCCDCSTQAAFVCSHTGCAL